MAHEVTSPKNSIIFFRQQWGRVRQKLNPNKLSNPPEKIFMEFL